MLKREVIGLGYETIELEDRSLPLLAPMSEVAGRIAIQVGSWCLQSRNGGRGVLLSGAPGVRPGKVAVIGGGIAGLNACRVAAGVGAEVSILDNNPIRLRYLNDILGGSAMTVMSTHATLEEEIVAADLVIGSVLVTGARAPRLITAKMVSRMKPGAVLVDLSIDQGGISETSKPTTHENPTFIRNGVVHYCVTNMPAMVPHTSTYALTNATLIYALEIADHGVIEAGQRNKADPPRPQHLRRSHHASCGRGSPAHEDATRRGRQLSRCRWDRCCCSAAGRTSAGRRCRTRSA